MIVQIIKKGTNSDTILGQMELPSIMFEPDESLHEDWYFFRNSTIPTTGGHVLKPYRPLLVRICAKCQYPCWNSNPKDNEVYKCEKCYMFCHDYCMHANDFPRCDRSPQLRIRYLYVREHILVSYLNELFTG